MSRGAWTTLALAGAQLAAVAACSGGGSGMPPSLVDASAVDTYVPLPDAGSGSDAAVKSDGGFTLAPNQVPDRGSLSTPGRLVLTASGESLAISGYSFPAASAGDPVFADGWELRFSHFISTFDKVSLWSDPEANPVTDQSQHGALVAEADGPWAIDLSQSGAAWPYLDGKETGERAVAFAVIPDENRNGDAPFPTDGTRLAVGFSTVVATPRALDVNLGPEGLAYYREMIAEGCVALYVGQAVWKGDQGLCTAPAAGELARIPGTVRFELCFKPRAGTLGAGDVETSFVNCDNQDNPGTPVAGEPHVRGVAFRTNAAVVGEITLHTDHPFWESTRHDTPARFDQFAAQATGGDGGIPTVHLEDVLGVDYTGFTDRQGNALPWRTCDPNYQNPNGGGRTGQMHFDPVAVPHCTGGDPSSGLCDYYDFAKYDQSTQGHWNGADGLCSVKRKYPSPP